MLTVFIFIIICIKVRVWNTYIYFAIFCKKTKTKQNNNEKLNNI